MPPVKKRRSRGSDRRERTRQQIVSSLCVFVRVVVYSAAMMAAFYLLALVLFLLVPSTARAAQADGSETVGAPVYDASLGGGSGILPAGLSEDAASVVSIARLESADASYDNTLVSFRGEVVGEPVNSSSDQTKWVLVQSSGAKSNSIMVLMTNEQVSQIKNWGAYGIKGATVRVTGIYRVADPNNTGALDVTAYVVTVVDEGGPLEKEPAKAGYMAVGLSLTALGVFFLLASRYQKKRLHP